MGCTQGDIESSQIARQRVEIESGVTLLSDSSGETNKGDGREIKTFPESWISFYVCSTKMHFCLQFRISRCCYDNDDPMKAKARGYSKEDFQVSKSAFPLSLHSSAHDFALSCYASDKKGRNR